MIKKRNGKWVVYDSTGKKELGEHDTEDAAKKQLAAIEARKHRVNLRTLVDNSAIRHETIDGRDHIVVPSYTLPDDVIMNGGLYPHDEIEASYRSLEGTLAPIGHPQVNGEYVSAIHPIAINAYHVGAFNRNVQRRGSRVYVEKVIDTATAQLTPKGQALLDAINAGRPIHTSTGIWMKRDFAANGDGYEWTAREMEFDHDAILLDEPGAATPEQGVGMMVNTADAKPLVPNLGEVMLGPDNVNAQRDALNQALRDKYVFDNESYAYVENFDSRVVVYCTRDGLFSDEYTRDQQGRPVLTGFPRPVTQQTVFLSKNSDAGLTLLQKVARMFGIGVNSDPIVTPNAEDEPEMTPEEKAALAAEIAEQVTNAMAPRLDAMDKAIKDQCEAITANAKAAEVEKRAVVEQVHGKDIADSLTGNALDLMYNKCMTAAPLLGGMRTNSNDGDKYAALDKPIA